VVDLFASGGIGRAIDRAKREMAECAAAQEFDRALACRKQIERLANLAKPAFSRVARLDRWLLLLVLPAIEKECVQLAAAWRGRVHRLAVAQPGDRAAIEAACERATRLAVAAEPVTIDGEMVDSIGLLTRWLFRPEKKRRGVVVDARDGRIDVDVVVRAAGSLVKKAAAEPMESHEIEAE
jgi:hypothetical protein